MSSAKTQLSFCSLASNMSGKTLVVLFISDTPFRPDCFLQLSPVSPSDIINQVSSISCIMHFTEGYARDTFKRAVKKSSRNSLIF